MPQPDPLGDHNVRAWAGGDYVAAYSERAIRPAEAVLLATHREALAGRALEVGCGAGRLTRVLVRLAAEVTAVDVSEPMLAAAARAVPEARLEVGDLRDLSRFADGSFGAVVAPGNVLDMLGDEGRRVALRELIRLVSDDGVLLFSSHNQAHLPLMDLGLSAHLHGAFRSPRDFARAGYHALRMPVRIRNRRAARALERRDGTDYALVNDPVHDHALVHYFISRDAQERQLAELGCELVDCLDVDGRTVAPGEGAERSSELHYAARRRTSAAN